MGPNLPAADRPPPLACRRYRGVVETRRLGRTGHQSSVAILGGAMFWDADPDVTWEAMELATTAGVNHLDVAPQYGLAEELMGPFIGAHRDALFVAGKTLRRNAAGVRAQLETTLERLHCDVLDLYQLHAVTDLDELDRRSEAIEVLLEARAEGLVRAVGITGHNMTTPKAQLEAIRRHDLDTVMLPINPRVLGDPQYAADLDALLDEARARDLGVMAIKAVAARPWGDRPPTASTWYEPYGDVSSIQRGIDVALGTPGVTAICTPGEIALLPAVLAAVAAAAPLSEADRRRAIDEVVDEALIFPIPT